MRKPQKLIINIAQVHYRLRVFIKNTRLEFHALVEGSNNDAFLVPFQSQNSANYKPYRTPYYFRLPVYPKTKSLILHIFT